MITCNIEKSNNEVKMINRIFLVFAVLFLSISSVSAFIEVHWFFIFFIIILAVTLFVVLKKVITR